MPKGQYMLNDTKISSRVCLDRSIEPSQPESNIELSRPRMEVKPNWPQPKVESI